MTTQPPPDRKSNCRQTGKTNVALHFPDGESAMLLVAARLRHVAGTRWGTRCYLDMSRLREMEAPTESIVTAG